MIHALKIVIHLLAQETVGEWMLAIALERNGAAILDGDDHAASIGAIVRANGPNRFRFAHSATSR
jgi:hypothetical protein